MFNVLSHIRLFFIITLFFHIGVTDIDGQYSPYTILNADDGLPSNYVYRIIQDKKGYIWISSLDGIARFDGYSVKSFNVPDGLPNNDVFEIIEDFQGRLWLLDDGNHMSYLRNDSIFTFNCEQKNRNFIDKITPDSVFYDDSKNIYVFDKHGNKSIRDRAQYFKNEAKKFRLTGSDYTSFFDVKKGSDIQRLQNLGEHRLAFVRGDHSNLIIRTESLDSTRSKRLDENPKWLVQRPLACLDIHQNNLQVFNGKSLYVIDSNMHFTSFQTNLPPDIDINTVFRDREENYWISTKKGVLLVNNDLIKNEIYFDQATKGKDIDYLFEYQNKLLYTTTEGNVFLMEGSKQHLIHKINTGIRIDPVYHVQLFQDELYYAFHRNGIKKVNISKYAGSPISAELYDFSTYSPKEPSQKEASLANYYASTKHFRLQEDYSSIMTRSFHLIIDHKNKKYEKKKDFRLDHDIRGSNIILTNEKGVTEIRNGVAKEYHPEIEKSTFIRYLDDDSYLVFSANLESWICDNNDCIKQESLNGYDFSELQIIDKEIWFTHNSGILLCAYNSKNRSLTIVNNYPINQLTNSNKVKALVVQDERLVVGTNKGIVYINKDNFKLKKSEINFFIEEIRSASNTFPSPAEIELKYDDNSIEIDFTALSFKLNNKITYHYQLEGVDQSIQSTLARNLRYPKLKPGNYTFSIQAKDQLGRTSQMQHVIICILRPWWLSYYFLIFCIGTIILSLYYLYKRRDKQLNEKAKLSQKFAELELNALQSQMNPHFVFNAMGSLQNLVQNNQIEIADMYIAKFARLMRMFLEGSKHKFVSIREEIEIVLAYFELEKLRFQDKISLIYENDLSTSQMQQEIPANLLQPFIENAINHGIFHKKNGGTIVLQLFDKGSEIEINIIDNGIGRVKAAEYKSKQNYNHKSRAIEILDEKIIAIQKLEGISIKYKIIDLKKNGQACGTKISLTLENKAI